MIFIIGAPRSGTKLLREILNNHSEVFIPQAETLFLYKLYNKWSEFGDLSKKDNFGKLIYYIYSSPFYSYLSEENEQDLIDEDVWFNTCTDWTYSHVMTKFFQSCALKKGKRLFGDKTPSYLYPIDFIRREFPGAKIVHLIRDPRDYALSVKKAWNKNMYRSAERWNNWVLDSIRDLGDANDFIQVSYENLINAPQLEIEKVVSLLGIEMEDGMFVFNKSVEPVGDAKGDQVIRKNNFGKWEKQLSDNEILKIEELCFTSMNQVGYTVKFAKREISLGANERYYYKILDVLNLLVSAQKRGGLEGLRRQLKLLMLSTKNV